jgi:hypothetical protein
MLAAFGVERMLAAQPTSLNRASRWFLGQAGPLLRYVCTFLPSACVGKFIEEADVKVFHSLSLLLAAAILSACATAPTPSATARSELAPTGKLRVGLLVGNPVFVTKDGAAAEM